MVEHHKTPYTNFSENMDSTTLSASEPSIHIPVPTDKSLVAPSAVPAVPKSMHVYQYETDTENRIMSMATSLTTGRSRPFLQRVQLIGPTGYAVRATGQVDDGAMRNCISRQRWEKYGHCLSPLEPSTTLISVANNQVIKPLGRWFGTVRVGTVSAQSWFEVFDCKGAFDIILG